MSPKHLDNIFLKDKIVVVTDVLRATSTIHYALLSGITEIIPQTEPSACMNYSNEYILAGEKNDKLIKGFSYLNAPYTFKNNSFTDKKMCFCSTNGTKAIIASKGSKETLIGSFLNIGYLTKYLLKQKKI